MAHIASKKNLSICFESSNESPSSEKVKKKRTFVSRFLQYRRDGDARQFAKKARAVSRSIKNGFDRAAWTKDEEHLADLKAFARVVSGLEEKGEWTIGQAIKMDGLGAFVAEKYKATSGWWLSEIYLVSVSQNKSDNMDFLRSLFIH